MLNSIATTVGNYGRCHNKPTFDETKEREKAMAVVEKYFDVDIDSADAAYDVLVDNGVHPQIAEALAHDMYPEQ